VPDSESKASIERYSPVLCFLRCTVKKFKESMEVAVQETLNIAERIVSYEAAHGIASETVSVQLGDQSAE
jgi:hypothetical protein